jgi:hypothetical protein
MMIGRFSAATLRILFDLAGVLDGNTWSGEASSSRQT